MYSIVYFSVQWIAILSVPALFLVQYSYLFLLLLVPIILLRDDLVRIRIRALRCFGSTPTTREAFVKQIRPNATVVGQGWHFFLKRERPSGPIIFTNEYSGRYTRNNITYWKSGTTIATMAKYYKKQGKAFHSLPSYENISLGAWVVDKNHGSGGSEGKPSNYAHGSVDSIEKYGKKYILGVEILENKLNENLDYKKTALFIENDMTEWLQPCFQRVLFIGKRTIGVVWKETREKPPKHSCCKPSRLHRNPHCCSRFCLWYQIDPLNTCCACQEPKENYDSVISNYHLNRFVPYIPTALTVFACLHRNYEIIVYAETFKDWNKLLRGLQQIEDGRFELRFGTKILFVDVSLRNGFERPFQVLKNAGFTQYALHKGKFQPEYLDMQRVSVEEIYNGGTIPKNLRF